MTSNNRPVVRVLIIPGLHDSGEGHWQSWLEAQYKGATRVIQRNWADPDVQAWSDQIDQAIGHSQRANVQWIAVAHSFGCLALAHHLARRQALPNGHAPRGIQSALMVAPADPVKFGLSQVLPHTALGIPTTVIGSDNDPWMPLERARQWSQLWKASFVNLGAVGHINTESGFGPWPLARYKVDHMIRMQQKKQCLERSLPC